MNFEHIDLLMQFKKDHKTKTKIEKLAISCNLFNILNVFTHPNDNIWFSDCVLKTKNEDDIKNISRSRYSHITLGGYKVFLSQREPCGAIWSNREP